MTPPASPTARPEQTAVLELLAGLDGAGGLLLAGGTPLAWLLGHRVSFDLDLVAADAQAVVRVGDALAALRAPGVEVEPGLGTALRREAVIRAGGAAVRVEIAVDADHTGELDPPEALPWPPLRRRSLRDLAAGKAAALAARREPRDYADILALGRRFGAAAIAEDARRKYRRFSAYALARALAEAGATVPDLAAVPVEWAGPPPDWTEALRLFEAWAREILDRIRP